MIETIEASDAVVGEFRKGFQVHAALAAVRQERVNAASRAMESRLMDGIGQLTHRIDADLYWLARSKFGARCWSDPVFLRDCEKKGLVQRVAGRSDRVMLDMGKASQVGSWRAERGTSHFRDRHSNFATLPTSAFQLPTSTT